MEQFSEIGENVEHSEVYHGLQIERQAAPTLRRVVAYAIDLGIVYAVLYLGMIIVVVLALGAFSGGALLESFFDLFSDDGSGSVLRKVGIIALGIVIVIFSVIVYHGYFIYFELKRGATPGKRIFGLNVVSG